MAEERIDWNEVFGSIFDRLKQSFEKDHPGMSYEKSHPAEAAYADLHRSLPVPVKLMLVRLKPSSLHRVKDGLGYLISLDLAKLGEYGVEDLGERTCSLEEFFVILHSEFRLSEWDDHPPTPEFPLTQFWDWDPEKRCFTMFLPVDIVEKPKELYNAMWMAFRSSIWHDKSSDLTFEIDFNSEFDLEPDPVLTTKELLRPAKLGDELWDMKRPEEGLVRLTLRNLQKHVQNIHLIPSVPKGVRDIFTTAKRLYVFAYFDESFRQVAEHYATLSLEAALKSRYWQEVEHPAILSNRRGDTRELVTSSYHHVFHFCVSDPRWSPNTTKVNGRPFLYSIKQLLNFMEDVKLLTRWEQDMCRLLISVRNSHSHPESISVMPANRSWLEMAARFVNTLYMQPSRRLMLLEEHRRHRRLKPEDLVPRLETETQGKNGSGRRMVGAG